MSDSRLTFFDQAKVGEKRHHGEITQANLSPFRGQYGYHYQRSISYISEGSAELDKNTQQLLRVVLTDTRSPLATSQGNSINLVRQFLEKFFANEANLAATQKAYTDKAEEMTRLLREKRDFLIVLKGEIAALGDNLTVDNVKKLLAGYQLNIDSGLYDALINECDAIDDAPDGLLYYGDTKPAGFLTFSESIIDEELGSLNEEIGKYENHHIAPMCVSFVAVKEIESQREFILIGVSSPDKNQPFIERLDAFVAENNQASLPILVAEHASGDFNRLLHHVAFKVSPLLADDHHKACAEKSIFSTLLKLMNEKTAEKVSIELILNFGFYPKPVGAKSTSKKQFAFSGPTGSMWALPLIAPCADCKKNMSAVAAMVSAAEEGLVFMSPMKKPMPDVIASQPRELPKIRLRF